MSEEGSSSTAQPQLGSSGTKITDLDVDALVNCASYLSLNDVANMAMSCKHLQQAAYSDYIWRSLFRQRWPLAEVSNCHQPSGLRDAYLAKHTTLQQFKYDDPQIVDFITDGKSIEHIVIDKDAIIFSQQVDPLIH